MFPKFLCKETGHLKQNSPKAKTIRLSSNRPPGVSNFNVEFTDTNETTGGVLDSLDCSSLLFDDVLGYAEWKRIEERERNRTWLQRACVAPCTPGGVLTCRAESNPRGTGWTKAEG